MIYRIRSGSLFFLVSNDCRADCEFYHCCSFLFFVLGDVSIVFENKFCPPSALFCLASALQNRAVFCWIFYVFSISVV